MWIRLIFWLIDWYSVYAFLFITLFLLVSFKPVFSNLKEKKLYREAVWLRNGIIFLFTLDILLFFTPRLILYLFFR